VAIFLKDELKAQHKYKLDNRCSNNQAEQLAIIKALELIPEINIEENTPRTIGIYTDSRITIDSLKNATNHSSPIEEIRKRIISLESTNWSIGFAWVKAHVGIYGNELADRLAKAAASSMELEITYDRTPKNTLYRDIEEEANQKWQQEWERSTKVALTKQFIPYLRNRIKLNININRNFSAVAKPGRNYIGSN
jgi:ribonuclease HI